MGGIASSLPWASAAISAVLDAVDHRPGGMIGVVVGLALLATGLSGVIFVARSGARVAALEREELRNAGLDDGLPKGAFVQGQRVGLEASDKWMVAGALGVGAGLLFAVSGALDPQVGWKVGVAFACVGFLPAAFFMWIGPGTKLADLGRHREPPMVEEVRALVGGRARRSPAARLPVGGIPRC